MTTANLDAFTVQHCPAGKHADWAVDSENPHACPWCEVEQLQKQHRDLDRALGDTIDQRDYAQDMADKLAAAIAPEDVLGEHSSANCPWQNALDWAPEKERTFKELRKELADTAMMRDFNQRSAEHLRAELDKAQRDYTYDTAKLKRERDEARAKVHAVETTRCWTNEDGKRFLFADDVLVALSRTDADALTIIPLYLDPADVEELALILGEERYRLDKGDGRPVPQPRWGANVRIHQAVNKVLYPSKEN